MISVVTTACVDPGAGDEETDTGVDPAALFELGDTDDGAKDDGVGANGIELEEAGAGVEDTEKGVELGVTGQTVV